MKRMKTMKLKRMTMTTEPTAPLVLSPRPSLVIHLEYERRLTMAERAPPERFLPSRKATT